MSSVGRFLCPVAVSTSAPPISSIPANNVQHYTSKPKAASRFSTAAGSCYMWMPTVLGKQSLGAAANTCLLYSVPLPQPSTGQVFSTPPLWLSFVIFALDSHQSDESSRSCPEGLAISRNAWGNQKSHIPQLAPPFAREKLGQYRRMLIPYLYRRHETKANSRPQVRTISRQQAGHVNWGTKTSRSALSVGACW